jgi:hypothetical protein
MVRRANHPPSSHPGERRSPAGAERSGAGRAAALTAARGRSPRVSPLKPGPVRIATRSCPEVLDTYTSIAKVSTSEVIAHTCGSRHTSRRPGRLRYRAPDQWCSLLPAWPSLFSYVLALGEESGSAHKRTQACTRVRLKSRRRCKRHVSCAIVSSLDFRLSGAPCPLPRAETALVRNRLVSSPGQAVSFAPAVVISPQPAPVGARHRFRRHEQTGRADGVCGPAMPYARPAQRGRRTQPRGGARPWTPMRSSWSQPNRTGSR